MMQTHRAISLAITAGLHVSAAAVLLQFESVRRPLREALPLAVNLIVPPRPEAPKPPPPRPRPVVPLIPQPLPVLTVPAEVPSPVAVAPQPRPALPPEPAAPVIAAPVVAAPAPPPPPAVVPPSFDAAYLRNPPPAYPAQSRRRGERGRVLLHVFVTAEGGAQRVEVRESSGFERLDQAAADAVKAWRFVPARQGERSIAAWVLVPIVFSLES